MLTACERYQVALRDCVELRAALKAKSAEVARLTTELADKQATLNLFVKCLHRTNHLWREAHPDKPLELPDGAEAFVWLKEQVDKLAERRCETCKQYLSGYWCMTHRYSPNVNASCSDWQGEET